MAVVAGEARTLEQSEGPLIHNSHWVQASASEEESHSVTSDTVVAVAAEAIRKLEMEAVGKLPSCQAAAWQRSVQVSTAGVFDLVEA